MKSYRVVPIEECGEPLVAIPPGALAFTEPHPYAALGAPYGGRSPWLLRRRVLVALLRARDALEARRPGWTLKLFDAYRPNAVQAFMVWREFQRQADLLGTSLAGWADAAEVQARNPDLYERLADRVFEFWGIPSDDPRTPPPHSTGAAVDLSLADAAGQEVDMGCPIDETSERAYPDHYARAASPALARCHEHRLLLDEVMRSAGFSRHGNEWWHFSLGDQMWAWTTGAPVAIYGRAAKFADA